MTKHFVSEDQALRVLKNSLTKYKIENGVIRLAPGETSDRVSESCADAIDYLCQEWDYSSDI